MKKSLFFIVLAMLLFVQCKQKEIKKEEVGKPISWIQQATIDQVIDSLTGLYGAANNARMGKGVGQAAVLWRESDGSAEDFKTFCIENYIDDPLKLDTLFLKLSRNSEILSGYMLKMMLELKEPLDLDVGEIQPIDELFGGYDPASHVTEDFFNNRIAFITVLNFPFYSLKEKSDIGPSWSRKQWAYARMGDQYTSRVPSALLQQATQTLTKADSYISEYNIFMGFLVDQGMKTYFPSDLRLVTHWGLRDELKSHYGEVGGLEKQLMIYQVMKRIIDQSVPEDVINSDACQWDPYQNKVYKEGKEVSFKSEPDTRYAVLLANFKALKDIDPYYPSYPTYIDRAFDVNMEISEPEVEKLFTDFISSPVIRQVGGLIKKRIGRDLQPFDIWYTGFKSRGTVNEQQLDEIVKKKYPTKDAFENDLPNILIKLGFTPEKSKEITSMIRVDASRGIGHAWEAAMRTDKARLRTRIGKDGMNFKGYNIAVHEFGHNVEQTITLQDVDYYMLSGVPNTAFTEALAFIFQKNDLELLGIRDTDPDKEYLMTLDNCWAAYEIMGVSLVDMNVWKWMYANPGATPAQLKDAVISIAKDIWNRYYSDIFGVKDEPILAIYSHMIDSPLYLPAYPVGHLIDLQIEQYLKGKKLADEVLRMYTEGSIIPQLWMKNAVGAEISGEATLKAAEEALQKIK
ncbi:MAG: hypothetical protein NT175_12220 [Bacteroidetes bacterium]|nr:hypothetical protein [Bacteroidota bacterium]